MAKRLSLGLRTSGRLRDEFQQIRLKFSLKYDIVSKLSDVSQCNIVHGDILVTDSCKEKREQDKNSYNVVNWK